ncbi:hypothetical protein AVEN_129884-1 [Araneus ventricosus]|uniref:Uncharacterized protein n=1 Tax=Araneus ventricosus TaxID=182803 RepID=A0A4Y2MY33_ARAVE|nr:hypothetical protein AVEN_57617-1 [Araneus ventricosus]GBN32023.1 hypothetical protein AVEN_129884-1 [Araneus ventricosus]
MPTFYKRKEDVRPRGQWDPERLIEAIKRIKQGDISYRERDSKNVRKLTKKMTKLRRENLILNQVEDPITVHQRLMNVQTVSSLLHQRRKRENKIFVSLDEERCKSR